MSDYTLTDHERALLISFRDEGSPAESRRAQIILLSAEGIAAADITATVALSASQVYRWRREWEKRRLGIFPVPLAGEGLSAEAEAAEPAEAGPQPGVDVPRLPLELREAVGMLPDDPMAEAARKALFFNFERMLLNEPGSRLGDNIESVHDMRVATRRMRSAFRLFRPFFKTAVIKPYVHGLRDSGAALGEVRDLDVFMEKAQLFLQAHPNTNLDPLVTAWGKRLDKARRVLIRHLDSKSFARFVDRFHAFLITPGEGARSLPGSEAVVAYQVRHIAPRLIYEHYERVRAYEPMLVGAPLSTLHALRIDCKRLRYTLEFFEEVLGSEIKNVIKELKIMQDHLGDLNDTWVAGEVLRGLVDGHNQKYSGTPLFMRPDMSGVLLYAADRDAEQKRLLDTFPAAWANFNRDDVRRNLALAVSVL
jgi:CHAD domain-containing protein/transposase-like protein